MKLFVFGRPQSTYMKKIRSYVGQRHSSNCDGAINYGLQGSKLSAFLSRNPSVSSLPTLNAHQHGNKYDDVIAVDRALCETRIDACLAPMSITSPPMVWAEDEWVLKPYWSLGGKDIEVYTGQDSTAASGRRRYWQKRVSNRRYELRVHMWKWVDPRNWIFQKRVHEAGEEQLTWNHHTGGKFKTVREPFDPLHDRVREFTKLIAQTLGYQFGACDFIISNPGERGAKLLTYFLEWNLAPGWTLPHVTNAYKKYVKALETLTPMQFFNLTTENTPDVVDVREPIFNIWE